MPTAEHNARTRRPSKTRRSPKPRVNKPHRLTYTQGRYQYYVCDSVCADRLEHERGRAYTRTVVQSGKVPKDVYECAQCCTEF